MQPTLPQEKDDSILTNHTTVVTVTYGDRKHLLYQVLDSLRNMDVSKVVVVDNGATWPVKAELTTAYSDSVYVIEMGANTGSAKGFGTGIQWALDLGAEYIWLLDDDNLPHHDTLRKLLDAYANAVTETPRQCLAVLALRPKHQAELAIGMYPHRIRLRSNSFRGFHVQDIPHKIWRRTPWGRPRNHEKLLAVVEMDTAPYGGLLFHRDLISSIGLPRADYVLYADDLELTYRITKKGGKVLLITSAILDDLDSTWNDAIHYGNGFVAMLKGSGDFRAYYEMRNRVCFSTISERKNSFVFWLNQSAFMLLLFLFSVALMKRSRYRLLREAVSDGLTGKLGLNNRFML